MRLSILLMVASLLHLMLAVAIDDTPVDHTYGDTEDGDSDAENGSGEQEQSQSEMAWVSYAADSNVHIATVDEVDVLQQYLGTCDDIFAAGPRARLESYFGEQMEDGPNKEDKVERVNSRPFPQREDDLPVAGTVLEVVPATNFYPEFGVGLLENGCTAFLIGPQHALTSAHCVYDFGTSSFSEHLNMWRGRNLQGYLDSMEWSKAIIPYNYFVSASHRDDWALIVYTKKSSSKVWLKMGYSENVYNAPYTVFGYLSSKPYGAMYSTVCRSLAEGADNQTDDQLLSMQCGSDECFDGGPVLRGYNFQRSKMPVAYGISGSDSTSFSFRHSNVVFQPKLFWSLCYLMSLNGFDAKCALIDK